MEAKIITGCETKWQVWCENCGWIDIADVIKKYHASKYCQKEPGGVYYHSLHKHSARYRLVDAKTGETV